MAKCKACIHNEMCAVRHKDDDSLCCYFKDRSRYVVRENGEWERYADDKFNGYDADGKLKYRKVYTYECPACGKNVAAKTNFSPNCGADMRKGENDGTA